MTLSAEKIETYREGLWQRLSQPLSKKERATLDKTYTEAKSLAQLLVKKHGARRVLLFGSVARHRPLRSGSDIDLAVAGMSSETYYQIVGDLQTASGRVVDLVRLESLRPSVKRIILSEGVILADDSNRKHTPSNK